MDRKTYNELQSLYLSVYEGENLQEQSGQSRMRQLIQKNQQAAQAAKQDNKPAAKPQQGYVERMRARMNARRSGSSPSTRPSGGGGAAASGGSKPAPAAPKPAPAAAPAARGGGGGGGGAAASGGSKPAPKPAAKPAAGQTGDKAKDTATWAKANPKLAAAAAEKSRIRGTAQTDNPLMKDFRSKMPAGSPTVQSKDVSSLGKGNQSLKDNPNAGKAAEPKKALNAHTELDAFDVIMEHLLDQGFDQAEAIEIMIDMSEEKRNAILEARRSEKEGKGSPEKREGKYLVGARGERKRKGEMGGRHYWSGGEGGSRSERGVSGATQKRVYADHGKNRTQKALEKKAGQHSARD